MKVWDVRIKRSTRATALTGGVFDQDIQLLVHSNLKGTILGILCLISINATVSLGDKRLGDAACMLASHNTPSSNGAIGQIIRQQDHDAVRERSYV